MNDEPDHLATHGEAMAEYARNMGGEYKDSAWLLTSYDVWVPNPHYVGPPVEHPENYEWEADRHSDDGLVENEGQEKEALYDRMSPAGEPEPFDEIPF